MQNPVNIYIPLAFRHGIRYMVKNEKEVSGGLIMIRRPMTPAFEKLAVIDLTNFLIAISLSEHAIKTTIRLLKQELFGWERKGGG